MNKKFILIAVVLLGAGLIFWGKGGSAPNSAAPAPQGVTKASLSDNIPLFDFGEVSMAKGKVMHAFELTNDADTDLEVQKSLTSCMCTEATLKFPDGENLGPFGMPGHGLTPSVNKSLKPGESLTVEAVFDPAAHGPAGIGPVERQILLETSKGRYMMGFRADVTP